MLTAGWCMPDFLKLLCVGSQYACLCVRVCLPLRQLITISVMWCGMDKLNSFYMAAVISIISRCGLRNKAHHRNQPIKSKLVLNKPLLQLQDSSKQLYINNKMECLGYKSGCDVCMGMYIDRFKRRAGLRYRESSY